MNEHPSRDDLASSIGQSLRAARKARDLTQEQTAELVGISSEFFARMERGRAMPSIATLLLLADALEISPGTLLASAIEHAAGLPAQKLPADIARVVECVRDRPSAVRLFITLIDTFERFEHGDKD